jgi:peptidoglycan/xylan/chitin deacetylase (PgdA/CDA1 family)
MTIRYAQSMRDLQPTPRDRVRHTTRAAALAGLRRLPRSSPEGIRVVHYHYVFDDQRDQFARQIELLATELVPVSLSEAVRRLEAADVEGREVAVTFDDGFRNQLTNAAPVLAEHGIQACFFLISDLVGATEERADEICRERIEMPLAVPPLDWDEVHELPDLGHELGSHTRTHPNLALLDAASCREELAASKAALETRLGKPVAHFSAPFGSRSRFTESVAQIARETGYESCATAQRGLNSGPDDVYRLRRDHLVADWSLDDVRYFLRF